MTQFLAAKWDICALLLPQVSYSFISVNVQQVPIPRIPIWGWGGSFPTLIRLMLFGTMEAPVDFGLS